MAKEIEPKQPSNEVSHFDKEGEVLTRVWETEALVVKSTEKKTKYVVTKVVSGAKQVYKEPYPPLRSTHANLVLAPEDISSLPYDHLTSEPHYQTVVGDSFSYDTLFEHDPSLQVGDRIMIERWSYIVPGKTDTSWFTHFIEKVKLIESGVDITEEERQVEQCKLTIRQNFAGIIRRLEQLQMDNLERVTPDEALEVQWQQTEGRDSYQAHYIYGDGSVEDHFVDVVARPYDSRDRVYLGGDKRFTHSGSAFVARDIIEGESDDDSELFELSIAISSETKLNPEVDIAQAFYVIGDQEYLGVKDIELSTIYFDDAGDYILFDAFEVPGEPFDGVSIAPEDLDALSKYNGILHELTMIEVYDRIESRNPRLQLSARTTGDMLAITARKAEQRKILEEVHQEALLEVQPVIDRIKATPLNIKLGTGGRLLVPRSQLGSVKLRIKNA